jgi:hypothetical protein
MRDARHGMSRSEQRTGGGGRTIGFGLIAVLVALLVAYLGRCLPGFGTGGGPSSGPASPEAPAAEEEPKPPADTVAAAISFTVRGDTCAIGDEEAVACQTLCASLPGEHDTTRPVVVHAAHGTHSAVERLRECLGAAGFSNVALRTE